MLERRSEKRIVDHHHRLVGMARGRFRGALDVGHDEGRIGGRFEQHDAAVAGAANGGVERVGIARPHRDARHAERLQKVNQSGGAAIKRRGVDDGAVGPGEGEERRHDGRHPGIENRGVAAAGLERHNLVFQDLGVGMREAGVDQVGAFALCGLDLAGGDGEGVLGRLRAGENVGRAAENRRPGRSERQAGIESAGEHGGARAHRAMGLVWIRHKPSYLSLAPAVPML